MLPRDLGSEEYVRTIHFLLVASFAVAKQRQHVLLLVAGGLPEEGLAKAHHVRPPLLTTGTGFAYFCSSNQANSSGRSRAATSSPAATAVWVRTN